MNTSINGIISTEALDRVRELKEKLDREKQAELLEIAKLFAQKEYEAGRLTPEEIVQWRGVGVEFKQDELTIWDKLKIWLNPTIIGGLVLGNWKTTVTGLLKAIFVILAAHNVEINSKLQETIIEITAIAVGTYFAGKGAISEDKLKQRSK